MEGGKDRGRWWWRGREGRGKAVKVTGEGRGREGRGSEGMRNMRRKGQEREGQHKEGKRKRK